jgi:transcriptional regulator with XRE-family HTH domain
MGSDDYKNKEVLLPTSMVKDKIFLERNKKGYKQSYVANKLGMSEKAYRNIEQGITQKIQVERLEKIATILGMEDWHNLLEQNQSKVTQILNADNNSNNNQNNYNAETSLIHENEKLEIKLAAKDQELTFLKRENQLLQDKIQHLEELLQVYKQKKAE